MTGNAPPIVHATPIGASTPLEELLGEVPVDAFFGEYFPARHLVVHGDVERLPAFFRSGVLADPRALASAYRGPVYVTNRTHGRFEIHGVDARECFEDLGLSVGFVDVESLLPGARDWLEALEAELGVPRGCATIAVFVNGSSSGLSVHCDPHEHFAVHLSGPKSFRVRPSSVRFPNMKHVPGMPAPAHWLAQSSAGLLDEATLAESGEHVPLHPGSVLFTPRGLYHETLAGDDVAMTAVIAFRNPTPAELVATYLGKVLQQAEAWRRPLDFAWSADHERRDEAHARLAALLQELAGRVAGLSIPHLLASVETGPPRAIEEATRLQREPSTRVVISDDVPGRVRIDVALELGRGRRMSRTLPAALGPLLAWLASHRAAFSFGEACARFPEWDRTAVASVVASFVKTGALVEVPFEAW